MSLARCCAVAYNNQIPQGCCIALSLAAVFAIIPGLGILYHKARKQSKQKNAELQTCKQVLEASQRGLSDHQVWSYTLRDSYAGETFFDSFDFWPDQYFLNRTASETSFDSLATVNSANGNAIIRVDNLDFNATLGRHSVRVISKKSYDKGLFLFDVAHSPYGCTTLPAIWFTDPYNIPKASKIIAMAMYDTDNDRNSVALSTPKKCKIGNDISCPKNLTNPARITKERVCQVVGPPNTYGKTFNDRGGGIYAVEIKDSGIKVWLVKDDDPSYGDIFTGVPDPYTWPTPLADFPNLECDMDRYFGNLSIIIDIEVQCKWAGQSGVSGAGCPESGTCGDWIATKPDIYQQAYWEFRGINVYQREFQATEVYTLPT